MDLGLSGLKAVVLGGTRGIGRATVERLTDEGCAVAFCARSADGVAETEETLRAAGRDVRGRALDVRDAPALRSWIAAAAKEHGGLDILISNASALATAPTIEAWQEGLDVDIMGAVVAVDAALPVLRRSRAAAIALTASTAGVEVYSGYRPYNAIKAALINCAASLATELAPEGIRVNAVSPGLIYFDGGIWQRIEQDNPKEFARMRAKNPMGRLGRPEEIANAIAFLVSPAASFITGVNLVADGGLTKRVQY